MDIKAFEYVAAIVKYGSLSKASEELYVSQPALSQYINKLEQNLNVQLFFREGRRLKLTPAGEIFMQDGNKILNVYSNMCHRLTDVDNGKIINIHLGISQFYGRFYLPYILPSFMKKYPNVRFSITEALNSDLEEMLLAGKLDVCMFPMYVLNDKLEYQVVHMEEIMIAVPANSSANAYASGTGAGKVMNLKHLRNENFIMLTSVQKFSDMAVNLCTEAGFEPNIVCEVLNWDTLNLLVSQGLGVGFVSSLISSYSDLPSSPHYYHIASEKKIVRPYGIVHNKMQTSELVTEFINMVLSLAEKNVIPNVSPIPLYF